MTRKRRRLLVLLACGAGLGTATAVTLTATSDSLQLFMAPSDIAAAPPPIGRVFRLGGLVEAGSLERTTQGQRPTAIFKVTDLRQAVTVEYSGILPDLFREGQGAVALGTMLPDGTFKASEVLAKHDETYMPRDVADALKKSGRWKPEEGPPPPASTWNDAANVTRAGG